MAFCKMNKIEYKKVEIRILKGQHLTDEYKRINPAKRVPAMTDGDFTIGESHTIMRYLHQTRKLPDHWYPQDAKKRAKVDEYLDWHHSNLRQGVGAHVFKKCFAPLMGLKFPESEFEILDMMWERSLRHLNSMLVDNKYLWGDEITIADLSAYCELTQIGFIEKDYSQYTNIKHWEKQMFDIPEVAEVTEPVFKFTEMFLKNAKAKI